MSTLDLLLTKFFESNQALQESGPLIIAVSGGRDSICLLHWLTHSPLINAKLIAVTIDHGLRPESAAECEHVQHMALEWGGECQIKQTLLTPETFTENSGRIARYNILQDAARQAGATFILTGHHAGDQAESVLLHLLRGSGLTGLTGMREQTPLESGDKQKLVLVRPMLAIAPEMINAYAAEHLIFSFKDPSNSDEKYTRNRIRHSVVPLLEEKFNPQIQKSLSDMSRVLQDDWEALEEIHAAKWEEAESDQGAGWCSLEFNSWQAGNGSYQRYVLRRLYAAVSGSTQDLTQENLEAARFGLIQKKTDRRYQLSGSVWVQKAYDMLLAYHKSAAELFDMPQIVRDQPKLTFPADQPLTLKLSNNQWEIHLTPIEPYKINLQEAADNRWVTFLAVQKDTQLTLRGRRESEAFRPFRFDGDVYLKKLMIDRKIPAILRDRWPLIADETGILWVAGHRLAARAAITADTRFAVKITVEKCSEAAG